MQEVTFARLPTVLSIGYLPAVGFNFLTGVNANGNPQYAKFRFALDLLSIPFTSPGAVRYAGIGKYMAVGDESGNVYLVEGKVISKKVQLDGLCAAGQFSITRKFIFVPDPCDGKVLIFHFRAEVTPFTRSVVSPIPSGPPSVKTACAGLDFIELIIISWYKQES